MAAVHVSWPQSHVLHVYDFMTTCRASMCWLDSPEPVFANSSQQTGSGEQVGAIRSS